jgi:hypothetical protein
MYPGSADDSTDYMGAACFSAGVEVALDNLSKLDVLRGHRKPNC